MFDPNQLPYPPTSAYIPFLDGTPCWELEKADRAFVEKLEFHGLARIEDGTVQIRKPSDEGYSIPYDVAVTSGKAIGLDLESYAGSH